MTRENKLALVVGFALILFVGILISDHFSTARNQAAADLRRPNVNDPLVTRAHANVIDLQPSTKAPAPTTLVSTAVMPVHESVRPEQRTMIDPNGTIYMGGGRTAVPAIQQIPEGFVEIAPEAPAAQIKVVFHEVRGGETLYAICRQHYGDTTLAVPLAKFNEMDDPRSLRAGRRLRIPAAEELGGRTQIATSSPASSDQPIAPPAKPTANSTYTVKAGDSLAQIAQRFLGSKSKWKKLHDMNRDVLEDPDDLKVGMVLRVL